MKKLFLVAMIAVTTLCASAQTTKTQTNSSSASGYSYSVSNGNGNTVKSAAQTTGNGAAATNAYAKNPYDNFGAKSSAESGNLALLAMLFSMFGF